MAALRRAKRLKPHVGTCYCDLHCDIDSSVRYCTAPIKKTAFRMMIPFHENI